MAMFKQTGTKKPGSKKFSWKKFWSKLRPSRKKDLAVKGETRAVEENLPSCSRRINVKPKGRGTSKETDRDVIDIHEIDKDRIRTTCKEALENPPEFPSREEVKEKIENAHKYYGIKCIYNHYGDSEDPSDEKELQPSWYYILERPLVEQYVLMNNYIRKLSVMASLKNEQSGVEEPAIEEEVSSLSSSSDYADFAPDSKIVAKLKELKERGAKDSLPSQIGASRLEEELMGLKQSAKSAERTITTNEYTIVIREPPRVDDGRNTSSSTAVEFDEIERQLEGGGIEGSDHRSSGDHLPNMSDFDLSQNLVNGPVEIKSGVGHPSYYHWQGNSTPTKTPLLNMDCQPPVWRRAPGTARDFLSFRSLSLSSEFVDSCRDYSVAFAEECRSGYLKDLAAPEGSDDDLEGTVSSATQTDQKCCKPCLSLTWEDPTEKCLTALADPVENPVVERAALASDCSRECGDQAIDFIDDMNGKEIDSADVSRLPACPILEEDEHSPYQLENDEVLRTSVSQMGTYVEDDEVLRTSVSQMDVDFTESESLSSMETQILAKSTNLE